MLGTFTNLLLGFIVLTSFTSQRLIPHRDERYSFKNDCDEFKDKKITDISEAQTCLDYSTDSGFQCCFVKIEESTYCMVVKKNNSTDLHELMNFVSNQGPYATITCNGKYITLSLIILAMILI